MVIVTSSLKSMSFPAMALDEFYETRHELPPNEWSLSLIRQLLAMSCWLIVIVVHSIYR